MDAEITSRADRFHQAQHERGQTLLSYVSIRTGSHADASKSRVLGPDSERRFSRSSLCRWITVLGKFVDAIDEANMEDDTLVIFARDNGPEATNPIEGGIELTGTYFTAMEG